MAKQKKADVWMPLYISDYMADTMHLNTEQHGAYLLLIMAAWKSGGTLPNSPDQLQAITRLSPAKWKTCEPILKPYFMVTEESWSHKRVIDELERAKKNSEARSKSGKKGASSRWRIDDKWMANAMANGWQMDGPSPIRDNVASLVIENPTPPSQGKVLDDA